MINKRGLSWLTTVPASDINFINNVKTANNDTLIEALKNSSISKTARKKIESELVKRSKKK